MVKSVQFPLEDADYEKFILLKGHNTWQEFVRELVGNSKKVK